MKKTARTSDTKPCLACGATACFLKAVNAYRMYHCVDCGLEFCNPMPSAGEINAFYREYKDIRAQTEVVKLNAKRNLDYIRRQYRTDHHAHILDFGSGQNLFIETCRLQRFPNSFGHDPFGAPVSPEYTLSWDQCIARQWDLITLWGVLEHLTEPVKTMRALCSCLKPDAAIILTTVCTETTIPYQHKPPEHTLYFTRKSLDRLGIAVGLSLVEFAPYSMMQDSDVYLSILLRTVPREFKERISHSLDKYVEVPTNEVLAVFKNDGRVSGGPS